MFRLCVSGGWSIAFCGGFLLCGPRVALFSPSQCGCVCDVVGVLCGGVWVLFGLVWLVGVWLWCIGVLGVFLGWFLPVEYYFRDFVENVCCGA